MRNDSGGLWQVIPEGDGEIEVFVYVVLGIADTFRPTSEG